MIGWDGDTVVEDNACLVKRTETLCLQTVIETIIVSHIINNKNGLLNIDHHMLWLPQTMLVTEEVMPSRHNFLVRK
jgi:hypothetical protein